MLESELTPNDVESVTDVHAHPYWYLANFMIARRRAGVPRLVTDLARDLFVFHAAGRLLNNNDFAAKYDREVIMLTVVEAHSIRTFARQNGFVAVHCGSSDPHLSKLFYRCYDRAQLKAIVSDTGARLNKEKLASCWYRFHYKEFFLQPPS
jgi:hypothetical protein